MLVEGGPDAVLFTVCKGDGAMLDSSAKTVLSDFLYGAALADDKKLPIDVLDGVMEWECRGRAGVDVCIRVITDPRSLTIKKGSSQATTVMLSCP